MKEFTDKQKAKYWRKYTRNNKSDRPAWLVRYAEELGFNELTKSEFVKNFKPENGHSEHKVVKSESIRITPEQLKVASKILQAQSYAEAETTKQWIKEKVIGSLYVLSEEGNIVFSELAQGIYNKFYSSKWAELNKVK